MPESKASQQQKAGSLRDPAFCFIRCNGQRNSAASCFPFHQNVRLKWWSGCVGKSVRPDFFAANKYAGASAEFVRHYFLPYTHASARNLLAILRIDIGPVRFLKSTLAM